jgi:hypothetical protein
MCWFTSSHAEERRLREALCAAAVQVVVVVAEVQLVDTESVLVIVEHHV